MFDIGFSKLLLIGGIALVVIGPERLPRVARTIGTLLGRAQRYVADVKAEVSRSIEIEELSKMKQEFETAARDVEQSVHNTMHDATGALNATIDNATGTAADNLTGTSHLAWTSEVGPVYERPRKNWRVKRGVMPQWYKRREGVRAHVQSGAARVARHRPARTVGHTGRG